MNFPKLSSINIPITALYYGFLADLGSNPKFILNLYSSVLNELTPTRFYMDVSEMTQVGDNVLIVGTVYLNSIDNKLEEGNYTLNVGVSIAYGDVNLLYIPITIKAPAIQVETFPKLYQEITSEQLSDKLRTVVYPGVKIPFSFSGGTTEWFFSVNAGGSLVTDQGVLLTVNKKIIDAVKITPAGSIGRKDVICIYHDKLMVDVLGGEVPIKFLVIRGLEDGNSTPPSIPPRHNIIAYVDIEPNTSDSSKIHFSYFSPQTVYRPISNVPSLNIGDGVRRIFEFPSMYKSKSSALTADGVQQNLDVDYIEHPNYNGRGAIEFIGEAPYQGCRVAISYSEYIGQFYDDTYQLPVDPDESHTAIVPNYTRLGLVGEFLASNAVPGIMQDSAGSSKKFYQQITSNSPVKGWDITGDYLYFNGNQFMNMDSPVDFSGDFTVSVKFDHRDIPQNGSWMRILTRLTTADAPYFYLMYINGTIPSVRLCSGTFGNFIEIDANEYAAAIHLFWEDDPLTITVSRNSSLGTLTLDINGFSKTSSIQVPASISNKTWVLGSAEDAGVGSRLYGKIMLVNMWNRQLSNMEIGQI